MEAVEHGDLHVGQQESSRAAMAWTVILSRALKKRETEVASCAASAVPVELVVRSAASLREGPAPPARNGTSTWHACGTRGA
ncbi:hypothetical protein ACTMU2_23815 [Cupriavidus basilensis]